MEVTIGASPLDENGDRLLRLMYELSRTVVGRSLHVIKWSYLLGSFNYGLSYFEENWRLATIVVLDRLPLRFLYRSLVSAVHSLILMARRSLAHIE